jgi:hypothetical protein
MVTGDSVRTIAFGYRLGHSTAGFIIKDLCSAIVDIMHSKVTPRQMKMTTKESQMNFELYRFFSTVWVSWMGSTSKLTHLKPQER